MQVLVPRQLRGSWRAAGIRERVVRQEDAQVCPTPSQSGPGTALHARPLACLHAYARICRQEATYFPGRHADMIQCHRQDPEDSVEVVRELERHQRPLDKGRTTGGTHGHGARGSPVTTSSSNPFFPRFATNHSNTNSLLFFSFLSVESLGWCLFHDGPQPAKA